MDLGVCWQNGVWANGSWVDGAWCPNVPCTPYSPGECWAESWCNLSWDANSWCPSTPPVPPATVIVEQRRWPGPPIVLYRETDVIPAWQRKREDEEIIIL